MRKELKWCQKKVKERWKDLVISQKIYEEGKELPEKFERIKLPFVEEEIESRQFFPILKKFLKISFGENGSMASVIKDGNDILAIYFEPVENCVIKDFKEYYPENKKKAIELLKELKPKFIKIVDVKFADLLYENLKNKKTDERFLATFLIILYSLKKGYLSIRPAKNIFKILYLLADVMEIKSFDIIPKMNLPVSYELVSNGKKVRIKENLIKVSVNIDKTIDLLVKLNSCENMKELLKIGSKEGIKFLKSDGIKIKNAFGFWRIIKHYTKDMDENILERVEDFIPQAERIVILVKNIFLFIEFDCGEIKNITINKRAGTNEEILDNLWENYGYIDVFVDLKKNKFNLFVPDLIVPRFKIPDSPFFLLKLLKEMPDFVKT